MKVQDMTRGIKHQSVPALRKAVYLVLCGLVLAACSVDNIEGPIVTCSELACGRYNDCLNGIIAQCLDGKTVRYYVCNEDGDDVCNASWQTPGAYRCEQAQTDCEGCRPERTEGCNGSK